jgi:hypothetical protein
MVQDKLAPFGSAPGSPVSRLTLLINQERAGSMASQQHRAQQAPGKGDHGVGASISAPWPQHHILLCLGSRG